MLKGKIQLLVLLLLLSATSPAQTPEDFQFWKNADQDLAGKKNLLDLNAAMDSKIAQARQSENDALLARCLYYQLRIKDLRTEDTLYYKNFAFIDSALEAPGSSTLLRLCLHLVKAQRIENFLQVYYQRHDRELFRSADLRHPYASLSPEALQLIQARQYEEARSRAAEIRPLDSRELLWLCEDPLVFFFKPGPQDIVIREQMNSLRKARVSNKTKILLNSFLLEPDLFMSQSAFGLGLQENDAEIFRLYQQWYALHRAQDPAAAAYIECLARNFCAVRPGADSLVGGAYERFIQQGLYSPYTPVKAYCLQQQFIGLIQRGDRYHREISPYDHYSHGFKRPDSSDRWCLKKAAQLFQEYRPFLDSFPFLQQSIKESVRLLSLPELTVSTQDILLPGQSIKFFFEFKNTDRICLRWVRLPAFERNSGQSIDPTHRLLLEPAVREETYRVQNTGDYQLHRSYLNAAPLQPGYYALLYSDGPIRSANQNIHSVLIRVSAIAVINSESKVFVLHRDNGFPLKGAKVTAYFDNGKDTGADIPRQYRVNDQGFIDLPKGEVKDIEVVNGTDSLLTSVMKPGIPYWMKQGQRGETDWEDYLTDNTHVQIFTDRAIYRPGQKVYFKGILVTHDPHTGRPLVLNSHNVPLPFFLKTLYKIYMAFGKDKMQLMLNNPFDDVVDSFRVRPNRYGSFSGSFSLPVHAATGKWNFEFSPFEIDQVNQGNFSVEEYKRPSMELKLFKPEKELLPGDSFHFRARLRSFSGASMAGTRIHYSLDHNGYIPLADSLGMDRGTRQVSGTLLEGEGTCNEKGELEILVKDSIFQSIHPDWDQDWNLQYELSATALDKTGESTEETLDLELRSRPLRLRLNLPTIVERSTLPLLYPSARDELAGVVYKKVSLRLYRLISSGGTRVNSRPADYRVSLADSLLEEFYPVTAADMGVSHTDTILVGKKELLTGSGESFSLPRDSLEPGNYLMETECRENGFIRGKLQSRFKVFDRAADKLPDNSESFHYLPVNSANPGDSLHWFTGNTGPEIFSIYQLAYFRQAGKSMVQHYEYQLRFEKPGIHQWQGRMPAGATGSVSLSRLYIEDGRLQYDHDQLYLVEGRTSPQIVVERFRSKIAPGEQTSFAVSVQMNEKNLDAELLTTAYDGSLDKISEHRWEAANENRSYSAYPGWTSALNNSIENTLYSPSYYRNHEPGIWDSPLWWWGPGWYHTGFQSIGGPGFSPETGQFLQGRAAGLSIGSSSQLNEVVVTGYGAMLKRDLTGSVSVVVRGNSSLSSYSKLLIVLDGKVFEGSLDKIDPASIVEALVLKGADAVAIYGARAGEGVILISTRGPVQVPVVPAPEPPLLVRKNFKETAFFLAQVHADRHGLFTLRFTLPESLTEWKWKMLAHTKKAAFAYAEKTFVSQLPLMVQPEMPRFLTQGDGMLLQSRVSNLDTLAQPIKLSITIESLETGMDITSQLVKVPQISFNLKAGSKEVKGFFLKVPEDLLSAIKIRITARSDRYSDGEEHLLPILATRALLVTHVPFNLSGKDSLVNTPALPADARPLGLSLYIRAQPQAAMLEALPGLIDYPYNCAEQLFNKIFARLIAKRLAAQPGLNLPESEQQKNLPAADTLPDTKAETAMPWLGLQHRQSQLHRQLAAILDTVAGQPLMEEQLEQLWGLQNPDGGMPWFKGGHSNGWVSAYLLSGFGQLEKAGFPFTRHPADHYRKWLTALVNYTDRDFSDTTPFHYSDELSYLYGRSFYWQQFPPSAKVQQLIGKSLEKLWLRADQAGLGKQARLLLISLRLPDSLHQYRDKAHALARSLGQQAISDEQNGARFKELADEADLGSSSEETIVRLAEAFEQTGVNGDLVKGIVKWLLTARQEHGWGSTRATGDAIQLLNRQLGGAAALSSQGLQAKWDTPSRLPVLTVTNSLVAGQELDFQKLPTENFPGLISLSKTGSDLPAAGGLNYYYFSSRPPAQQGITLTRTLRYFNRERKDWLPLDSGQVLLPGDRLRISLEIFTEKRLSYVLLEDHRSAAEEPVETASDYHYEDGLDYYSSISDVGNQFFIEELPRGRHLISYETRVSAVGEFFCGLSTLQCFYRPAIHVYSGSRKLVSKEDGGIQKP